MKIQKGQIILRINKYIYIYLNEIYRIHNNFKQEEIKNQYKKDKIIIIQYIFRNNKFPKYKILNIFKIINIFI